MVHPARISEELLLRDCVFNMVKRSGPGGQHRNKTESGVVVIHRETDVRAEASEERSQHRNKKTAIFRLRLKLALNVRQELSGDAPSEMWKQRTLRKSRIGVNPSHKDFPAMLSEALDTVFAFEFDFKQSSEYLGVSSTQLVRFLAVEKKALAMVNDMRQELGLRPLRP